MGKIVVMLVCVMLSACAGRSGNTVDAEIAHLQRDTARSVTDTTDVAMIILQQWMVGETVDSETVYEYGIDRCFGAEKISDSIFAVIDGVSYHNDSPVKRDDLRYLKLLHYDAEGNIRLGEMICNKAIAPALTEIFRSLFDARYPIEKIRLIDNYAGDDEASMADNNTSCYNCRIVHGGRSMSQHAYGMAVDINPLYNPYVKTVNGKITDVAPSAGIHHVDRDDSPYKIVKGDPCHRAFTQNGFTWGGNWRRSVKDYQHFQHKP